MRKPIKIFLTAVIISFLISGYAYAVATLGGTLIKKVPGKRMIVIKLKSGTEKNVILVSRCKAYRLNQRAHLSSFRIGEQIVIKICSPLNANPLKAEILMDKFSAKQYASYKTTTPLYDPTKTGGGYATTGGAAPIGLPPVTGVYPNAVGSGWPNNNQLPNSVKMGSSPSGGGMKAAPAPWGSPAIGPVLSGSGGGGGSADWGSPAGGGGGESISGQLGGGNGSVMPSDTQPQGVIPGQGAWVANPTAQKKRGKNVSFQGKVFQVNHNYNAIYVNSFGQKKTYTVMIRPKTKILDFMSKQQLTLDQIRMKQVVQVTGTSAMDGIVDATTVMVQR